MVRQEEGEYRYNISMVLLAQGTCHFRMTFTKILSIHSTALEDNRNSRGVNGVDTVFLIKKDIRSLGGECRCFPDHGTIGFVWRSIISKVLGKID
jgi:hypothetical protein